MFCVQHGMSVKWVFVGLGQIDTQSAVSRTLKMIAWQRQRPLRLAEGKQVKGEIYMQGRGLGRAMCHQQRLWGKEITACVLLCCRSANTSTHLGSTGGARSMVKPMRCGGEPSVRQKNTAKYGK